MAQREIVVMVDDLDGTESDDVETVEFAFDGRTFEIDLTPENRITLATFLDPYIAAARQTGGKRKYHRTTRPATNGVSARASS